MKHRKSIVLAALLAGFLTPAAAAVAAEEAKPESKPGEPKADEKAEKPAEPAAAGRPAFEDLLRYNSEAIFGGKVTLSGDQMEVLFDGPGQMVRGFEGKA